ncbi:MAG TPA: c-type cytochrome [Acidimicrobiia bacterium]
MSSNIVITLAAIGGIAWLGFILVNALRRRGPEEIPSNLAPGKTDDELETRRLENGQKAAVLLSAFLAVSLPLYFLGERDRQEGFVDQFSEESVTRGAALVEEFACFSCHGPNGAGGVAQFVEPRSGVTVQWQAPSLDDVFYRYDEEEVNFWITYGRGNTPMPPWGVAGGGAMNEAQVQDIVNYLKTIQKPQAEAVAEVSDVLADQVSRLQNGETTAEDTLRSQRQVLADVNRAPELAQEVTPLAEEARQVLDAAGQGIDTDGDGLSDSAETRLVEIGNAIVEVYQPLDPVTLDPEAAQSVQGTDDLETAEGILATLESLVASGDFPILEPRLEAVDQLLETGTVDPEVGLSETAISTLREIASSVTAVEAPAGDLDLSSATTYVEALEAAAAETGAAEDVVQAATDARAALDGGQDNDGDGLSNDTESALSTQVSEINSTPLVPAEAAAPGLDPTNPEGAGQPDATAAETAVAGWETLALNLNVTANNIENLRAGAEAGVAYLERALEERRWEIDIEGVAAAAFDGDVERAERAVLLFNGYCARCHTAGFSAGVPFTLEAGSGGFGPALWDGRPTVQFGPPAETPEEDLLVQFIINGSEAQEPYGLNGFGSGRMPAFGQILPMEDIQLIAQYLRGGDLTGMGEEGGS